jgi:hypothetical protein
MRTTFVLLAALATCIGSIEASDSPASERPWTNARSTIFGRDAWSLHTGSCGYGESCIQQCSHSGCVFEHTELCSISIALCSIRGEGCMVQSTSNMPGAKNAKVQIAADAFDRLCAGFICPDR